MGSQNIRSKDAYKKRTKRAYASRLKVREAGPTPEDLDRAAELETVIRGDSPIAVEESGRSSALDRDLAEEIEEQGRKK